MEKEREIENIMEEISEEYDNDKANNFENKHVER